MKKIIAIAFGFLAGTSLALAHQAQGGSTNGLFGLKAEYLHVLLNPLPVYGLAMGVLVLAAALVVRSKAARNIGLVLIVLCAASAWPVLYYGQHGYNHLHPQLDTESQQWLDAHMERAERFIYAFYLTALLGIATFLLQKRLPKTAKALTLLSLLSAVASVGIGGWISCVGGAVSHSEFRDEDPPPAAPAHPHNMPDQPGGKLQTTNTADVHAPAAPKKTQLPNTPEGIWEEIHKHHSALESAIKANKLGDIHPHAMAIKDLTKALVDVVHPDHKPVVQSGADKINLAVSDMHKAAHADDQGAAEANFKRFDEAAKQLEEQMKKQ
ncbi:MAG: hypothetical protein JWR69_3020 [Pedosphaera sp.]|nr:hypothetical protein [Pedosphaera sp.]